MKNECKHFGSNDCLCSACQSMREAIEKAKNTPKEEIKQAFAEAEQMLKEIDNKERMVKNE